MDYYSVLGVSQNASDQEIKRAYRKLAMQHHPDRGGNPQKFQDISNAYDILSDPQKRQMFDMGGDPNNNQGFNHNNFDFNFTDHMDGFFHDFGFGFNGRHQRNKTFNIVAPITLEEVFYGKDLNAEISDPEGNSRVVNVHIPKGIQDGQHIRFENMGDHTFKDLKPGDLIVNVHVKPHPLFARQGNDLITEKKINVFDAILGTSIVVNTLDNKQLNINIPAGVQPETVLSCKGEGLPDIRHKVRGNLLIKIKIDIPKNLTQEQKDVLQNARNLF